MAVRVDRLTKTFPDFWRRPKVHALRDVSFEIARGEVFGMLGPNGSGKSTTLKIILGLLYPTSGSVEVLQGSPRDVGTKSRIGYLPEESCLYRCLTAEETLHFYGKLFNLTAGERRKRVDQLLDMVGLRHAARRRIGEFSKGMGRRIGIAQALINDPDLVILDEPTSGLDPIGCRQVKDLILTLAERGKTVILASHLLADVEDVCSRIAVLYNGRIRVMGLVRELLGEQGAIRMTMRGLSPETLRRVLALIREQIGQEPEVDHPTRDLEQFFIEVIEKARDARDEDSGVGRATGIASYLSESSGE